MIRPGSEYDIDGIRRLFDLTGTTAVVVGAGGGIGAASALGLALHGAHTVCVDVNEAGLDDVHARIRQAGGSSEICRADILDRADVARLVERHGTAEVLVVTPAILVRRRLLDQSEEDFDRQIDLNVRSIFRVVTAFGREMAERGRGSIIGYSSVRASVVEPGAGVYAATKAAVLQLLRTLAAELGPSGVRVNLIAPSPVETPLTADVRSRPEWYAATAERAMLKRWARPEDFIGPLVMLASPAGAFVTGAQLAVDGGWTAADGMGRVPG